MSKKIIFLDVSGSVCYNGYLDVEKEMLKALIKSSPNDDFYICLFSDKCVLLSEKDYQRFLSGKDITQFGVSSCGTSIQSALEFFSDDFYQDANVVIITDDNIDYLGYLKEDEIISAFVKKGVQQVKIFRVDKNMVDFFKSVSNLLPSDKKEEKNQKNFEPTVKAKEKEK